MPPELVVRTDRAVVNRWHGGIVVVHVTLAVAIVVIMIALSDAVADVAISPLVLAPFMILLLGQVFQVGVHCFLWGSRVAISHPLTVTTAGLVVELPQGHTMIDWPAVASVHVRRRLFARVLVISLHPAAVIGAPGVRTEVSPRAWRAFLRRGIMLGGKGIVPDLDTVLAAVADLSGRRVPIGLAARVTARAAR